MNLKDLKKLMVEEKIDFMELVFIIFISISFLVIFSLFSYVNNLGGKF